MYMLFICMCMQNCKYSAAHRQRQHTRVRYIHMTCTTTYIHAHTDRPVSRSRPAAPRRTSGVSQMADDIDIIYNLLF